MWKGWRKMETNCEFCSLYYVDEDGYGECQVNIDEDEMYRLLNSSYKSCPYYQNDKIEIRESEPYSYCQFIMGKDHTAFGRARHPFMTGSGGWAYFSATRYMLGIRPSFEELSVNPCIPADWKEFSAVRRWRDAEFDIRVENPGGVMKGVKEVFLDGEKVAHIPVQEPGTKHAVVVVMG